MRITKETDRMNITLDTEKKEILVTQKWKYTWQTSVFKNAPQWLPGEQDNFRREAHDIIQRLWSNKICFKVKSLPGKNSEFAGQNAGVEFSVRVEVRQVEMGEHWKVYVVKVPEVSTENTFVEWDDREIYLTSEDIQHITVDYEAGKNALYGVAHEFGHAFGNTSYTQQTDGDEYHPDNLFFRDINSIMCIGCEVRGRHFYYLQMMLEEMFPDTEFLIILK